MTAKEACEKAKWNRLPEKIKKEIERCVEKGLIMANFYESSDPDLFSVENLFNIKRILKDLGYFIEIYPVINGKDTKLEISWNL